MKSTLKQILIGMILVAAAVTMISPLRAKSSADSGYEAVMQDDNYTALYAIITDPETLYLCSASTGQPADSVAWAAAAKTLTEVSGSAAWGLDVPAIPERVFWLRIYDGSSPAATDPLIKEGYIDGGSEIVWESIPTFKGKVLIRN